MIQGVRGVILEVGAGTYSCNASVGGGTLGLDDGLTELRGIKIYSGHKAPILVIIEAGVGKFIRLRKNYRVIANLIGAILGVKDQLRAVEALSRQHFIVDNEACSIISFSGVHSEGVGIQLNLTRILFGAKREDN